MQLFQNTQRTIVPITTVQAMLSDPFQLPRWNPVIVTLTREGDHFKLKRRANELNTEETVTLTVTEQQISYRSAGEHFSYDLIFKLRTLAQQTVIDEEVQLLSNDLPVPVTLMAPIIKQAFKRNLQRLIALLEADES